MGGTRPGLEPWLTRAWRRDVNTGRPGAGLWDERSSGHLSRDLEKITSGSELEGRKGGLPQKRGCWGLLSCSEGQLS